MEILGRAVIFLFYFTFYSLTNSSSATFWKAFWHGEFLWLLFELEKSFWQCDGCRWNRLARLLIDTHWQGLAYPLARRSQRYLAAFFPVLNGFFIPFQQPYFFSWFSKLLSGLLSFVWFILRCGLGEWNRPTFIDCCIDSSQPLSKWHRLNMVDCFFFLKILISILFGKCNRWA